VAIVGIGKVVMRPWMVDGAVGPRPVATVTLAADHRVSDGHIGALFLAEIGKLLQEPDKL
jgi:pyruvate dehydrogenase E2 component (dihydrolipoamide acetyltransferase)